MLRVDLTENVTKTMDSLTVLQKQQLPFAIARALTRTAAEFSMDALPKVMERQLDRPTPFTKRAGRYIPATKENQTAKVYLAPLQYRYLRFQIRGGLRIQKGFEAKYESIAQTIEKRQMVPGSAARLNQYGNVSRAAILKMGQEASVKGGKVFVGIPQGRNTFGVWQRDGKRLRAVFIEPKSQPSYKERLMLLPELENFAGQRFDFHFATSLALLD
ncbi:MAG: hypothetical protein ACO27M_05420 [Vulcanococcus sp.]